MAEYLINAIEIIIATCILFRLPCFRNNRGSLTLGKYPVEDEISITEGNTVYTVRGFYRITGRTLSEKLMRNMEKELDNDSTFCYDKDKSQKGLDCRQERSNV